MTDNTPMKRSRMTWVQTYSGRKFDLLNPEAKDVYLPDIAHQLARVNRFSGATNPAISVAEHSVLILRELRDKGEPMDVQIYGLMHDAHEAYFGDFTSPAALTLALVADFHAREVGLPPDTTGALVLGSVGNVKHRIDHAIFEAIGFEPTDEARAKVKAADGAAMMGERDVLLSTPPEPWDEHFEAMPRPLNVAQGWTALQAEDQFVAALRELGLLT